MPNSKIRIETRIRTRNIFIHILIDKKIILSKMKTRLVQDSNTGV